MTIAEMLDRLEAAEKAAFTRRTGTWGVDPDQCAAAGVSLHGRGWDIRSAAGGGVWVAHCHTRDDADCITAVLNALPVLLAWAREARELLEIQLKASNGHPQWVAELARDLLTRDVEAAK